MIIVEPADLISHREIIVQTLLQYLTDRSDERRFDWLYTASPHGQARAWLVTEGRSSVVVGAAAAFPRRFYMGDGEISAWVLGDFCLDPQYRSLGPALELQRTCLGIMESNGGKFCYDFPSAAMVAVYNRLGFAVTGKLHRLAKLLRVDRKVREIVKVPAAQRAVTAVGNALLKRTPAKVGLDDSLEISLHQGLCGTEFSILARAHSGRLGICIQRSAEYLNWRYVNNPLASHEIMTVRRHGTLIGYLVWVRTREDAVVVDLFGENNPAMVKGLLAEAGARLIEEGIVTLSLWLNESHPWIGWCSDMGFRVRDSVPVVCIPRPSINKADDPRTSRWFLMQGDRDS